MARSNPPSATTVREKMRLAADESGLTLEEIGLRMGFAKSGARQAVSRLLTQNGYDPRLSTLLAFAAALGKEPKDLLD